MKRDDIIEALRHFKKGNQRRYHIEKIGIFGSSARGDMSAESDIDVYVDYDETPSLLDIVDLENYLSDVLKEKVDLVPRECIRPELAKYILPTEVLV